MRNIFAYIVLIVVSSCSIDNLEPNQTETFLKFYSETNKMESKDLVILSDGYLILSTHSETSTLLLRTDLNGNKLWAQSFDNFQGNSLAILDDGYIMIGDGINNQNDSTYMELIKTDFNGTTPITTQVGYGTQHGSAVTLTSAKEIIALGYTATGALNDTDDSTYVIITGFDTNIIQTWDTVRTQPVLNVDIIPSKSIFEANNGNLTWISYSSQDEVNTNIDFTAIPVDSETPGDNTPLFNNHVIFNNQGDFVKTPVGFVVIQTIVEDGINQIGVVTSINGIISDENIISTGGNSLAASITNATNGLLIAATTDRHTGPDESARTDEDLLLLEINYNGTVKTDGINITYGGIGDEIPVRIRRANDGGYIVLGTLINSKGAQQTFLLKTNSKGTLN